MGSSVTGVCMVMGNSEYYSYVRQLKDGTFIVISVGL